MSNAMTSMHFITIIIPTIYRIVYLIFITSFLLNPIFGDIVKLHTVHCTSSIATNSCYIIKLHTQSIFWLVQICWNGENSIWTCTRFVWTVCYTKAQCWIFESPVRVFCIRSLKFWFDEECFFSSSARIIHNK